MEKNKTIPRLVSIIRYDHTTTEALKDCIRDVSKDFIDGASELFHAIEFRGHPAVDLEKITVDELWRAMTELSQEPRGR